MSAPASSTWACWAMRGASSVDEGGWLAGQAAGGSAHRFFLSLHQGAFAMPAERHPLPRPALHPSFHPASHRGLQRRLLILAAAALPGLALAQKWPAQPVRIVVPYTARSEEHTSELQSQSNLVCRLLLEKKKKQIKFRKLIEQITYPRPTT